MHRHLKLYTVCSFINLCGCITKTIVNNRCIDKQYRQYTTIISAVKQQLVFSQLSCAQWLYMVVIIAYLEENLLYNVCIICLYLLSVCTVVCCCSVLNVAPRPGENYISFLYQHICDDDEADFDFDF